MISSKIVDCSFALAFYDLCEKHGLDTKAVGNYIAFAIDLYEKGILTKQDTDGVHLEYANGEIVLSLVEKIARREGIGDVLADGVYRAARQIGRGAEKYAYHAKKREIGTTSPLGPHYILRLAISDKADMINVSNATSSLVWRRPKEDREAYLKSGFFGYPEEFVRYFLAGFDYSGSDYEGICRFTAYDDETRTLVDSTGLCAYWSVHLESPPITSRALLANLVSCVTGLDVTEAEVTRIAGRILNLVRAYNVREGIRRKDDSVPEIFLLRTPTPPFQKLDHDRFNRWLDRFYEIRGWNREGIPLKETLDKLDLGSVREDLERRGILAG